MKTRLVIFSLAVLFVYAELLAAPISVRFKGYIVETSTHALEGPSHYSIQVAGKTLHVNGPDSCNSGQDSDPEWADLEPNVVYNCSFDLLYGYALCYAGVGFEDIPACMGLYVNGVNSTVWADGASSSGLLHREFTIELRGPTNATSLATWTMKKANGEPLPSSKNGRLQLPADGSSIAIPVGNSSCTDTAVKILGDDLGCYMDVNRTIRAGTNTGTIHVRVEANCPSCAVEDFKIDLVEACGGCNSEGCSEFGELTTELHSLDVKFGLGWSKDGGSAEAIRLYQTTPGTNLTYPGVLVYNFSRTNVFLIPGSNGIRQIKAPEGLANIVISNNSTYRIEMYLATNVVGFTNKLYTLANSPERVFTLSSPGSDTNRLRITDSLSGDVHDYFWITNGWRLVKGDGLRSETKTNEWTGGGEIRTETTLIQDASGTITHEQRKTFKRFHWVPIRIDPDPLWLPIEKLVEEVTGSGPSALTNSYVYVTNLLYDPVTMFPHGNVLLQQATRSDGSWEYFVYDQYDRVTNVFSGFLNQPVTNDWRYCRLTEYQYPTTTFSLFPWFGSPQRFTMPTAGTNSYIVPTRTIQYLLTNEVARSYSFLVGGVRRDYQCISPGAVIGDTNNLLTVTRYYTNGPWSGSVQSILHPNGTVEIFQLGSGTANATNITYTGHPDSTGTNIDEGTKTIVAIGSNGKESSRTVIDISSQITISSETYQYDYLNRLTNTTYLDNTSESITYDCCNIGTRVSREGTPTIYSHDALHRTLTTTANGVTHSNTYNSAGNLLRVERIGTNGNVIVVQRNAYDTAGQMTATTNALGQVTLFTEARGLSGTTNVTTRLTNSSSGPQRIEARYLDGQTKSITGGLAHLLSYEYGPSVTNGGGTFIKEIKLDASGGGTSEWTIQFHDIAGRAYKMLYADGASSQTFYNGLGQVDKEVDPDGVMTLSKYNAKGERAYTVLNLARNGSTDWNVDRITWTTNYVTTNSVTQVHRTETRVWMINGMNTPTLISVQESAVNGLLSWSASFGLTNRSEAAYPGSGVRYSRSFAPDGSFTTTRFENGLAVASARTNSGTQLSATTFGLDAHNRQKFITDARNGTTTNSFDDLDRVVARFTPTPGNGGGSQRTGYQFDTLGQVVAVTNSDNTLTYFTSLPTGERTKTWGAREYPVEQTFTAQGRMNTIKTWREVGNESTAATTTWNYDSARGWLDNKRYADNTGPDYDYTSAGRLRLRTWARGDTTTYLTNAVGEVERITYSDASTGNVTNTFDRSGRVTTVQSGTNVTTRLHSEANLLLSETQNGIVVTNRFDEFLRRTNVAVVVNGVVVTSTGYGFDSAGRMSVVTDGTNSATYSFIANSPLVGQILFTNKITSNGMTTTKSNDFLNRLTLVTNAMGSENPAFAYAYNSANQRSAVTNENAARWHYSYDSLGQVTNGTRRWSDGSPVLGQQFAYLFDDIGNRRTAISGGDANGDHLRLHTYSANALNQYTSRTVPGWLDVIGTATNTATVTVNNTMASRKGDYYRAEVSVPNSGAVWQPITNVAVMASGTNDFVTNWTGNVFVPATPEQFLHDLDGSLTGDGRWTNRWDGENRLISQTSHAGGPSGSRYDLRHGYDSQSRRISKVVSNWTGSAWVRLSEQRFVYDGWNLLAILNESNAVQVSFAWGTDLSGSMQGAGGVGGLISMTVHSGAWAGTYFYAFDGNGNVAALVSAYDGTVVARYEYDPFHRLLRATGPLAFTNPFVASTKFCDWESGLLYYGYRFYDPNTGRWWNRDPIGEEGGYNLYEFVGNDQINILDLLGLEGLRFEVVKNTGGKHFHNLSGDWGSPGGYYKGSMSVGAKSVSTTITMTGPVEDWCCNTVISPKSKDRNNHDAGSFYVFLTDTGTSAIEYVVTAEYELSATASGSVSSGSAGAVQSLTTKRNYRFYGENGFGSTGTITSGSVKAGGKTPQLNWSDKGKIKIHLYSSRDEAELMFYQLTMNGNNCGAVTVTASASVNVTDILPIRYGRKK